MTLLNKKALSKISGAMTKTSGTLFTHSHSIFHLSSPALHKPKNSFSSPSSASFSTTPSLSLSVFALKSQHIPKTHSNLLPQIQNQTQSQQFFSTQKANVIPGINVDTLVVQLINGEQYREIDIHDALCQLKSLQTHRYPLYHELYYKNFRPKYQLSPEAIQELKQCCLLDVNGNVTGPVRAIYACVVLKETGISSPSYRWDPSDKPLLPLPLDVSEIVDPRVLTLRV